MLTHPISRRKPPNIGKTPVNRPLSEKLPPCNLRARMIIAFRFSRAGLLVKYHHLDFRLRESALLGPAAGSTGNIENPVDAGEVGPIGEWPTHAPGNEMILIDQARHFRPALRIIKIDVVACGWFHGC